MIQHLDSEMYLHNCLWLRRYFEICNPRFCGLWSCECFSVRVKRVRRGAHIGVKLIAISAAQNTDVVRSAAQNTDLLFLAPLRQRHWSDL